ncbi:retropepsin-like aspartic protease family protein [Sphingomonas jatrophae]|uniref:Aspartyl protease family protein n=1 Tax=Sphingomonas jatrophae TaxID=1166337 RepID=A0A1I6LS86_9SPHN|nr:TIGR02281 family clan AA aspartic protease [Sphingomonas jatrophae]SFS06140.1 aspartyl protease family protein [Sphingomonas jatrophae]
MRNMVLATMVCGAAIGLMVPQRRPAPRAAPAAPAELAPTVLQRADNGHFYAVAEVGGTPIKFMVDTGATGIALSMADARLIGLKVNPDRFEVVGRGASGAVRGQMLPLKTVDLDGRKVEGLSAMVADGLGVSLLGQSYLRHMRSVEIRGDEMTLR